MKKRRIPYDLADVFWYVLLALGLTVFSRFIWLILSSRL